MDQERKRGDQRLSRGERVIEKLRDDHLNEEEKKLLREICFDYQDVFYLPGDKLSCTNAAKHTSVRTRCYPHKHATISVA